MLTKKNYQQTYVSNQTPKSLSRSSSQQVKHNSQPRHAYNRSKHGQLDHAKLDSIVNFSYETAPAVETYCPPRRKQQLPVFKKETFIQAKYIVYIIFFYSSFYLFAQLPLCTFKSF